MSLLKEIDSVNRGIQDLQISLNNYSPYYPLPNRLKELLVLVKVNSDNLEFQNYLNSKCLEPLNDYIAESQKSIPDHIKDKEEYKKHTVRQMKEVAQSVVRCFKQACEYYKPDVI